MKFKIIFILFFALFFLISCDKQKTAHEKEMEKIKIEAAAESQKSRARAIETNAEKEKIQAESEKIQSETALTISQGYEKIADKIGEIPVSTQFIVLGLLLIIGLLGYYNYKLGKKPKTVINAPKTANFFLIDNEQDAKKIIKGAEEWLNKDERPEIKNFLIKYKNRQGT